MLLSTVTSIELNSFYIIRDLIHEKMCMKDKAMFKFPLAPKQSHTAGDYVNFYKSKSVHYRLPLTAPGVEAGGGGGLFPRMDYIGRLWVTFFRLEVYSHCGRSRA